jgi:hypothetical protein
MVRCPALHGRSPVATPCAWAPAHPRRHHHPAHREPGNGHGNTTHSARPGANTCCGAVRRLDLHRRGEGPPLTKESFGNMFSEAARAAGVKTSAHGVLKIAVTRAADSGATVAQLNAIFGWTGSAMASLYTQEADRRRLAIENMHKLSNENRTSIPAPCDPVRAAAKLKSGAVERTRT